MLYVQLSHLNHLQKCFSKSLCSPVVILRLLFWGEKSVEKQVFKSLNQYVQC